MRPSLSKSLLALAATALPFVAGADNRLIESKSLNPCMSNSSFSATLFNVVFTPNNRSLAFDIQGISNIAGKVEADLELLVYGYSAMNQVLDPCGNEDLSGMCPMNSGPLTIKSNLDISQDIMGSIPGIAYTVPDLDAVVRIKIRDQDTKVQLACVEAELSNGHSVEQKAVAWVTAVIAGLGLVASAVTSGLGHSNTAAHVAANAMSLFGYMQAQAFIGMTSVPLPPIVAAWTQNFQWSMGIIRVTFLQKMATWYQRATGGTPTTHLSQLAYISVEVQKKRKMKRAIDGVKFATRAVARLMNRSNAAATEAQAGGERLVLHGIERVGFKARIETTNIFFTGYTFFMIFVLFTVIGVIAFKYICEGLTKAGRMKGDKFIDFRNGWRTVLKGILFRVVLIGFPQMMMLGLWELTQRDSAGEVVLAILTMLTMIGVLGWASSKVVRIAQRSIAMHKNPAYILYSDPVALNKWGFLYVQFKAAAYWFIIPWLVYLFIKAMFVGLSQSNSTVQAVALVIIEAALLIGVSVLRPWMDKKTNGFNIAIAAVNFLSAVFLLMFTEVFKQPGIVTGAMGVIFFVFNAAFSLILLLMLLVSSGFAVFTKNPDTRYQPMRDDRGKGAQGSRSRIDDDDDYSSEEQRQLAAKEGGFTEHYATAPPRSPASTTHAQNAPPSFYDRSNASPAPSYGREGSLRNDVQQRAANNTSPWQRGAGYDH
ncbi:hypothetical protein OPT61_g5812 [Boeremia exigua]|uniref:Uncharacterized protein n=1 Tax=Boeremia exigua TaxID=749465 RepID=A0ACC2I922_9PLEO|nr:hypothetical protein OPT61_g5812 [Boeremia exigua]